MPRNKSPRKPRKPVTKLPLPVQLKRERDQRNAYVKAAARHDGGQLTNSLSRKLARHIGIQDG